MYVKPKYKDQLLNIIEKHVPGCAVYLFGSRATGKHRSGSDIDLALDAGGKIPYTKILAIAVDIEETTIPMQVDVVDLHSANDVLRQEVKQKGVPWKLLNTNMQS